MFWFPWPFSVVFLLFEFLPRVRLLLKPPVVQNGDSLPIWETMNVKKVR